MAGYLWQAARAAHEGLQLTGDQALSVERHDDLAITAAGSRVLLCEQLKHHRKASTISEKSRDWWSTIGVWATHSDESRQLVLVTTDRMLAGSHLAACYGGAQHQPWEALVNAMNEHAFSAPNQALLKAYRAWSDLESDGARRALLERVSIRDRQSGLKQAVPKLDSYLADERGVPSIYLAATRNGYLGLVNAAIWDALDGGGWECAGRYFQAMLSEAYATAAQPGHYLLREFDWTIEELEQFVDVDGLHLIPQLKAINRGTSEVVAPALETWFEARAQRQALREDYPTAVQDLRTFDQNLVTLNANHHLAHGAAEDNHQAIEIGAKVHSACILHQGSLGVRSMPLRFTNGSFYELSNSKAVRWHPAYENPGDTKK
jgi:hypothetical protein